MKKVGTVWREDLFEIDHFEQNEESRKDSDISKFGGRGFKQAKRTTNIKTTGRPEWLSS